jgi:glyoxylase-like metal-dependent hydrolase (beta-lactamase superfamily II)
MLLEGENPVVVDTGTGNATSHYLGKLSDLLAGRSVERIVLTHRHFDHSGGAAEMARELDAPVFIHEEGVAHIQKGDGEITGAWLFGASQTAVDAQPLKAGDVIDVGGGTYEVLHTPGHAPDAIALWHADSRTLIPGDTVYADGGIGRWDLKGGSYEQLVETIQRLADLGAEYMYSGHGPAVRGGAFEHINMGLRMARLYGG